MKKLIFFAMFSFLVLGITVQLFAQESDLKTVNTTRSNIKNNRSATDDAGVCVGKIRCADGACTINFDQEVVSPRDPASGLPTGKRMHKPFVITKELDKSSPMLSRESPTKQSTGKVSYSDLSVMISMKGRPVKLQLVNDQITLPADCPDGDCDLIVSWSWGASNSGSMVSSSEGSEQVKKYEATFNLAMENGEFAASKKNKSGHVTLMK